MNIYHDTRENDYITLHTRMSIFGIEWYELY